MLGARVRGRAVLRFCLALLAATLAAIAPARAFEPAGLWLTELQAEIMISPCFQGYCGIVAKPVKPGLFDINNPDPRLRGRPIEGMPMIWLTEASSSQVWEAQLYNPIDGKMYAGEVRMRDARTIYLRGCVFFVFCKAETWVKLDGRQP
ncbi:MAG: DUF2147 domain-containing protein [Cucumibacter sp.]